MKEVSAINEVTVFLNSELPARKDACYAVSIRGYNMGETVWQSLERCIFYKSNKCHSKNTARILKSVSATKRSRQATPDWHFRNIIAIVQ